MNKEKASFICVLADFLAGRKTDLPADLDWKELYAISRRHELSAVVYYQCRSCLPEEVRALFDKAYSAAVYFYVGRRTALQEIAAAFQNSDIRFFVVKGPEVAGYYPVPALRTMGDQDLVIRREDRERADAIMKSLGYTKKTCWDNKELGYTRDKIGFEIHDRLIYEQAINRAPLERFFENYWPYVKDGKLDVSYHFLYLLLHLRKHLMNAGVGFRMFMDLALMSLREPGLDWPWIREKLAELDLLDFASTCFALIRRWFGVESPFAEKQLSEAFYEQATEAIFANGVFGFTNEENRVNHAVNTARQGRHPWLEMAKKAVQHVFPPYSAMINNEHYRFVENRRWLLPAAWIYRIGRALKMLLRGKKNVWYHFASSEEIRTRDEYLKGWGL